ncbi:MAG: threonine/serine exporter family protein [Faecalibacterium sp.]|nr:threonine/serine exporter family protein [Faecalibacterium sp.]
MELVMAAGKILLENGAEVFRVEQTMTIMARSFHLREFNVYVLTNGIFASAGTAEISEVRNVPTRTTHLGRVDAVNTLSRRIAAGELSLDEAEQCLADILQMPGITARSQVLASGLGSACFAILFGGTLVDFAVAFAAGALLGWFMLGCSQRHISAMLQRMMGSALISAVCVAFSAVLPGAAHSYSIIGTLMVLTPGVAFTMGIRDFVKGDYLSGTIRMMDALLVAACIACGVGLTMALIGWMGGVPV